MMSLTQGKGWTGLLTNLFNLVKSVTSLTPPFGFATKKPGEHHSVGSVTFAITRLSVRSLTNVFAAVCKCFGTFLAVYTWNGIAFGLSEIDIGPPFMGFILRSSLTTEGNKSLSFSFVIKVSEFLSCRGKAAGKMPRALRSLKATIHWWGKVGTIRAVVSVVESVTFIVNVRHPRMLAWVPVMPCKLKLGFGIKNLLTWSSFVSSSFAATSTLMMVHCEPVSSRARTGTCLPECRSQAVS